MHSRVLVCVMFASFFCNFSSPRIHNAAYVIYLYIFAFPTKLISGCQFPANLGVEKFLIGFRPSGKLPDT